MGKYNLHHEDPLYSLFSRDVLGWKAGLSMLPHLNRVLGTATKPSFNQALRRGINFGGQDSDGREAIDAGGSGTSRRRGGGLSVQGLSGSRPLALGVRRLFHHPETSELLSWGKSGHGMLHWDSACALGAEGLVRSLPVHKSP